MTAWQDQPPISRRQVRQTERDENVGSQSTPEQNAPDESSFAGIARQGWEAEARRATAPQGPPETPIEPAITRGRRAQQPATNEQAAGTEPEPLLHITPVRPQVPSYDGASFRGRAISAVPHDIDSPTQAGPDPVSEQPDYRTRDFGPSDSRRSAFRPVGPPLNWAPPVVVPLPEPGTAPAMEFAAPVQSASAPSAEASQPEPVLTRRQMRELGIGGFVTPPSDTDEAERVAVGAASPQTQTEAAPIDAVPVEEAPVQEAPAEEAPAGEAPAGEAPIEPAPLVEASSAEVATARPRFRDRASRATVDPELEREEARRAEQLAAPPALIEPPARTPFTGAIPTNIAVADVTVADVIVADVTVADVTVAELVEPAQAASRASAPVEIFSTPVFTVDAAVDHEVVVAELEPHSENASTFEDLLFPSGQPIETTVEPLPADAAETTFDEFLTGLDAPAPAGAAPGLAVAAVDDTYVPPVGHWSTQALIDDDEQVQENTFARDVGATSGAITTSALVLPSMPTGENIMGPLSGTGEILITGSINLPSSMGSTGVHPARYDHSDVDALLEADDREDSSDPESAPVRAIRAISTNTVSGDVINSMRPQKASRLPLILIVSAAVMAVGVVVLLVAGIIFKIF